MSSFYGSIAPRPFTFAGIVSSESELDAQLKNKLYNIGDYVLINDPNKSAGHGNLYYIDYKSIASDELQAISIGNIAGPEGGSINDLQFVSPDDLEISISDGNKIGISESTWYVGDKSNEITAKIQTITEEKYKNKADSSDSNYYYYYPHSGSTAFYTKDDNGTLTITTDVNDSTVDLVSRNQKAALELPVHNIAFTLKTSKNNVSTSTFELSDITTEDDKASYTSRYSITLPQVTSTDFKVDNDADSSTYGQLLYDGYVTNDYKIITPIKLYTSLTTYISYLKDDIISPSDFELLSNSYKVTNSNLSGYDYGSYITKSIYLGLSNLNRTYCTLNTLAENIDYTINYTWQKNLSAGIANPVKYKKDADGNAYLYIGDELIPLTGNKYGLLVSSNIDLTASTLYSGGYEPVKVKVIATGNESNYKIEKYYAQTVKGAVDLLNRIFYEGDLESHCTYDSTNNQYIVYTNNDDDYTDISTVAEDALEDGSPLITVGERNSRTKNFYAYDSTHATWYFVNTGDFNISDYFGFEDNYIYRQEMVELFRTSVCGDDETLYFTTSDCIQDGDLSSDNESEWVITKENVLNAYARIVEIAAADTSGNTDTVEKKLIEAINPSEGSNTLYIKAANEADEITNPAHIQTLLDSIGFECSQQEPVVNDYDNLMDAIFGGDKYTTLSVDIGESKMTAKQLFATILEDRVLHNTALEDVADEDEEEE